MKFTASSVCLLAATAATVTLPGGTSAFLAPATTTKKNVGFGGGRVVSPASSASKTTKLYISSWGKGKSPSDMLANEAPKSPRDDIQSYLSAPTPVEIKSEGLDATCLVSGWEVSQQVLFELNNEDSFFKFSKIQVLTSDMGKTKKQLLSREARYTGLYSKLDYMEDSSGEVALPTSDQLSSDIQSWVAIVDDSSKISNIVDLCKDSSIKNLSILLANQDIAEGEFTSVLDTLKSVDGVKSSLIVVGELYDDIVQAGTVNLPSPCTYREINTAREEKKDDDEDESSSIPTKFSKAEGMKMVTECLQLESSVGKGFVVSEISEDDATDDNNLDVKLIKGLREAGYDRTQEVDHMLRYGTATYREAIDKYEEANPSIKSNQKTASGDPITTTNAWWEDKEFQKNVGILPKDDDDESGGDTEVTATIEESSSTTA